MLFIIGLLFYRDASFYTITALLQTKSTQKELIIRNNIDKVMHKRMINDSSR
jgi:hypothetical protein